MGELDNPLETMAKKLLLKFNQYESSLLTNTDCFRKHRQKILSHLADLGCRGWGLSESVKKGKFVILKLIDLRQER